MSDFFSPIEDVLKAIGQGQMVVVVDDEDRENEGDLILAAQFITIDAINFLSIEAKGMICTPITNQLAEKLNLNPMVPNNQSAHQTAFTVTIDASEGITTGISSYDRYKTILKLTDEKVTHSDFVRPGHIFPLIAKDGGVLERAGHTEAAVELCQLAGLKPIGVICEILNSDGTMARVPDLITFAKKHNLLMTSIEDLIKYKKKMIQNEITLKHKLTLPFPTKDGNFELHLFKNNKDQEILVLKSLAFTPNNPLLRIHSSCVTGDIFGSLRCDCGEQLEMAMKKIANESGLIIYLPQEGRGIGLHAKLQAYQLQDQGLDTVEANLKLGYPADERKYDICLDILQFFKIDELRLMTNNPDKVSFLKNAGINVHRQSLEFAPNEFNKKYLETKKIKMNHYLINQQSEVNNEKSH